ncbi:unnamed protein product, partial [Closterium sp. NIES-53]
VAASIQVFAAASRSSPASAPCSCRPLLYETLFWHHRLGHPSLPRLRGMASRTLVSGLPRSLPPLPLGLAPTCVPYVEGRQRAAPHSFTFPSTEAPLQTLHMDVKGEVTEVLIDWIRGARRQLNEIFGSDLPVLRLQSDRGGEFSSNLLRAFCRAEGIHQTFTLPASSQQNGIAERRIGMVMDVARTSMIHAAAPHFLWSFVVQYAAHQINLQPRVSLPETTPTLRWTGKVGDASAFRVWGSRAFVRNTSADKLSSRAIPCVFLGFPLDAPGWQFYHPTSRRVLSSHEVTFDESMSYYRVSQVDPAEPVEVADDSSATRGAEPAGAGTGVAEPGGAEPERVESGGAEPERVESGGVEPEGVEPGCLEPERVEPGGAGPGGTASGFAEPAGAKSGGSPGPPGAGAAGGAAGAGAAGGAASAGAAGGATGAGGAGGAAGTGVAGGAAGAGAVGGAAGAGTTGGADGAGAAGGTAGAGAAGGAAGAGATGAAGPGGARTGGTGAAGAGGAAGGGATGAAWPRPYYVPLLQQVLGPPPSLLSPPPVKSQSQGLTERREPESRPVSPESRPTSPASRSTSPVRPVRAGRRVSRPRPPPVPGTHSMTLRPSTTPQRVPLPSPPASSLLDGPDPESEFLRAASPSVTCFLATAVTNPLFESTAACALVAELVDFPAACRLDYATSLVTECGSASVCPPSIGGECALGTDVLEDRQEEFECFAVAVPPLVSMLLAPEGDPDAPDIPTPRSCTEAIEGPYSSQWQAAMDTEMASWKSTGTYADEVPPPGANIVSGMWIFRVKRLPGSPPVFKARYVARGISQRQGVDIF